MTEPEPTSPLETAPEPDEERWLFCGTRLERQTTGKRYHAWLPLNDALAPAQAEYDLYLFKPRGSPSVGCVYRVKVSHDGPSRLTKHGLPVFDGRHPDAELRGRVEAAHRAAEVHVRIASMESKAREATVLNDHLKPLARYSQSLRADDRDAFLAYVIRKLTTPW
jgi:hypothetical protein